MYPLCDYITPNETEATALTGINVDSIDSARRAADVLLAKGVGTAIITLGETGALFHSAHHSELVPRVSLRSRGRDRRGRRRLHGRFATALANGDDPLQAVRFACALASLSVTRAGTAPSMPTLAEIGTVLQVAA